jgi:hypothetical protein
MHAHRLISSAVQACAALHPNCALVEPAAALLPCSLHCARAAGSRLGTFTGACGNLVRRPDDANDANITQMAP